MNNLLRLLCEQTEYDETKESCLKWRVRKQGRKVNSSVGSINKDGYYCVTLARKKILVHHVVYTKIIGVIPEGMCIDHIDGNKRNNKIGNLRVVEKAINSRNMKKNCKNMSGVSGVWYDEYGDRWGAFWRDCTTNKTCRKYFSNYKYGSSAYDEACRYRELMIKGQNMMGAGYTQRHGTEDE